MTPHEALTRALFDAENTARPDEHPEEMAEYRERAVPVLHWLGVQGFEILEKSR